MAISSFKRFDSSEGNVWKYVFEGPDAVAESVLYKYESFDRRTVICCSVQSGCPVGCIFCGTGNKFIRNLTANEIIYQIQSILCDMGIEDVNSRSERFQIMFMSMGEPMLNWREVKRAIESLHLLYPNAELLLSTVGIKDKTVMREIIELSYHIPKMGLQFSIHWAYDGYRDILIPYKNKLSLRELRDFGLAWHMATGRPVFLNYFIDGINDEPDQLSILKDLFSPHVFNFTFSVVCSADENMKESGYRNLDRIKWVEQQFLADGYNTRIFDPAGQDDIGGGCGQLWYTQDWMKQFHKGGLR